MLPTLDEIREELSECETPNERLSYLIELGESLPPFPTEDCIEANRVLGCQSMVWLTSTNTSGRFHFLATSDAPMVRGLVAILLSAYSGKTSQEILRFPVQDFFASIALSTFVSPMRSNGLNSMVERVQAIAKSDRVLQGDVVSLKVFQRPAPSKRMQDTRSDFPILARTFNDGTQLVYFDNAASTQRPQSVVDVYRDVYERYYSNAHRSGHRLAHESTLAMEDARRSVQEFIQAEDPHQVIFTSGTTAAINMVARAWGDSHVGVGDEILLTEMEHHSNIVPWQQLAARTGAVLRWVPVGDDFRLDMGALKSLLSPRTKLMAVTAISNMLGTINPIPEIAELVHQTGAKLLVDAAQAVSIGMVDVQAMQADFVTFGGHKMLGPNGVGVLYGKREALESMPPFLGGGGMIDTVTRDGFTMAPLPHRLEPGTPAIPEIVAMKPAVEYLYSLGTEAMLEHERELMAIAIDGLEKLGGFRHWGPELGSCSGILTFTHDRIDAFEIGQRLDAAGIAIRVGHHCALPLHQRFGLRGSCRASFHAYNTAEEVHRMLQVLQQLR